VLGIGIEYGSPAGPTVRRTTSSDGSASICTLERSHVRIVTSPCLTLTRTIGASVPSIVCTSARAEPVVRRIPASRSKDARTTAVVPCADQRGVVITP
jgi:hypothetical protein